VSPEAALHLAKACKLVETAQDLMKDGYAGEAARGAYLAALQAAQAYIVEHAGRAAKTHAGAHSQFAQLAMHELRIDEELRSFLPEGYTLKAIADYEVGDDAEIPKDEAAAAVEKGRRFVECIAGVLKSHKNTGPPMTEME